MNEYEALANAIIEQAAKDYRAARAHLEENPGSTKAKRTVRDVEEFFCSDWFKTLTTVSSESILKMLKEEFNV